MVRPHVPTIVVARPPTSSNVTARPRDTTNTTTSHKFVDVVATTIGSVCADNYSPMAIGDRKRNIRVVQGRAQIG